MNLRNLNLFDFSEREYLRPQVRDTTFVDGQK